MAVAKELTWTHTKIPYVASMVMNYNNDYITAVRHLTSIFYTFLRNAGCLIQSCCVGNPNGGAGTVYLNEVQVPNVERFTSEDKFTLIRSNGPNDGVPNAATDPYWVQLKYMGRYFCLGGSTGTYLHTRFSDGRFSGGTSNSTSGAGLPVAIPTGTPRSKNRSDTVEGSGGTWWGYHVNRDLVTVDKRIGGKTFQFHGMSAVDSLGNPAGLMCFFCSGGFVVNSFMLVPAVDTEAALPLYMQAVGGITYNALSNNSVTFANYNTMSTGNAATSTAVIGLSQEPAGGYGGQRFRLKLAAEHASTVVDYYKDWNFKCIVGTGSGTAQANISAYDPATNECTVSDMGADLGATSEYLLCPTGPTSIRSTVVGNAGIWNGTAVQVATADSASRKYNLSPFWVYSGTSGHEYYRGRLRDIYWGPLGMDNGQCFDSMADPQWVQYGSLVVPNDGTPCPVT